MIIKGKIFSGDEFIENLKIVGGKIVGLNVSEESDLDFGERTVLPAFIDAHAHFTDMGFRSFWLNAFNLKRKKDFLDLIARAAQVTPKGDWILIAGFDETRWTDDPTYPTRKELDEVAPDHLVYARRICGHMAVINSRVIRFFNIQKGRNIDIERGILREEAMKQIESYLKSNIEKLAQGILKAQEMCLKEGVIAISEFLSPRTLMALRLLSEERLMVNLCLYFYYEYAKMLIDLGFWKGWKFNGVILNGIKIFLDGSIGARTAAFYDAYKDDPRNKGQLLIDESNLLEIIKLAERAKMQLAIHAIGDRAIDVALNALKNISKGNPLRHRIEHFEAATDDQIKTAAKLNIILSMQPNFLQWQIPGGMYERRLGKERAKMLNRFRTIINSGAIAAFGSDSMPFGPMYGVYWAVNHPNENEKINLIDAVRCYTYNSAYALFLEKRLGKIARGFEAKIIVLDRDIFSEDFSKLKESKVIAFISGEKIINL